MATLNLLCHLWPAQNEMLDLTVGRLVEFSGLFNGRVAISIAVDSDPSPAMQLRDELKRKLGHTNLAITLCENTSARESAPFFDTLLPSVASSNADEFTFFCHSKGVTMPENLAVRRWVNWMYDHNLGDTRYVLEALCEHACTGCFRLPFSPPEEKAAWHYSGTFFWLNHARVFGRAKWRPSRVGRWSVEGWLGSFVPIEESFCVFGDGAGGFYDESSVERFLFGRVARPANSCIRRVRQPIRNPERRLSPVDPKSTFESLDRPIGPELRHVLLAGADLLCMFGGLFEGGYRLQQVPDELASFAKYIHSNCPARRAYLEVGAASGGTARVLDDLCDFDRVYIIDDNGHIRASDRALTLPHATEFVGDSHSDACRTQLAQWQEVFDCVLIDGDHSYAGVSKDTYTILPFVASDGIVAFHDVCTPETPGVARWVQELRAGAVPSLRYERTIGDRLGIAIFRHRGFGRRPLRRPAANWRTNLLFHLAPIPSPMLEYHISMLGRLIPKFSNRVVVSVPSAKNMLRFDWVKDRLCEEVADSGGDPTVIEFIPVNDSLGSEADAFFDHLLPRISTCRDNEYTFFGHSKGVSRGRNPCVRLWVEWNYHFLLKNMKASRALLERHSCVGGFRLRDGLDHDEFGRTVPTKWYFAGTFFWLNNARVFADERWKVRGHGRWSVESWLGRFVPSEDACCVIGEGAAPLYHENDFGAFGGQRVVRQFEEFLCTDVAPLSVSPRNAIGVREVFEDRLRA